MFSTDIENNNTLTKPEKLLMCSVNATIQVLPCTIQSANKLSKNKFDKFFPDTNFTFFHQAS